jgi:hypothetical protein
MCANCISHCHGGMPHFSQAVLLILQTVLFEAQGMAPMLDAALAPS